MRDMQKASARMSEVCDESERVDEVETCQSPTDVAASAQEIAREICIKVRANKIRCGTSVLTAAD